MSYYFQFLRVSKIFYLDSSILAKFQNNSRDVGKALNLFLFTLWFLIALCESLWFLLVVKGFLELDTKSSVSFLRCGCLRFSSVSYGFYKISQGSLKFPMISCPLKIPGMMKLNGIQTCSNHEALRRFNFTLFQKPSRSLQLKISNQDNLLTLV